MLKVVLLKEFELKSQFVYLLYFLLAMYRVLGF